MAKGKTSEARNSQLSGKEYKDGIDELAKETCVRPSDLDEKALKFLDYLEANGERAKEAIDHLKQALEGLSRDHVSNWRAYVYSLLKKFDEAAYEAMKASDGKRVRPRKSDKPSPEKEKKDKESSPFTFNPQAAEFVPSKPFKFNADAVEFAPKAKTDGTSGKGPQVQVQIDIQGSVKEEPKAVAAS